MPNAHRLLRLAAALAAALLAGCSGYELKGKVIESDFSLVTFVEADDPRLDAPGVPNARLELWRDPETLGRKQIATAVSDLDGSFAMPVGAIGAGWMDETWLQRATAPRYGTAESIESLPGQGKNRRLLIMLAPGGGAAYDPESWRRDLERFR